VDDVALRARDPDASRRFSGAALAPLGFGLLYTGEEQARFGVDAASRGADDFWILAGEGPAIGVHVAFAAGARATVDALHRAALGVGGPDDGAPGLRREYPPGCYAAFVFDPNGSNVEAV
jgi:hypothetical protein